MTGNKKNIIITSIFGMSLVGVGMMGLSEHQENKQLTQVIAKLNEADKDKNLKINSLTVINDTYEKAITGYKKQTQSYRANQKKTKNEIQKMQDKTKWLNQELTKTKRELTNQRALAKKISSEAKSPNVVKVSNAARNEKTVETVKSTNTTGESQTFNVTFYTAGVESTGKSPGHKDYGRTASGAMVAEGRTIACPPQYRLGTKINIESIGVRICEDRGGAIQGNHLDVYVSSLSEASRLGRKYLKGTVLK